jgi:hypothetical protein
MHTYDGGYHTTRDAPVIQRDDPVNGHVGVGIGGLAAFQQAFHLRQHVVGDNATRCNVRIKVGHGAKDQKIAKQPHEIIVQARPRRIRL